LTNKKDVKDGVIAYKIAAHAANLAKGHPGRNTATTRFQKQGLNSGGKINSISHSIPKPRASSMMRLFQWKALNRLIFVRCVVRIFAA